MKLIQFLLILCVLIVYCGTNAQTREFHDLSVRATGGAEFVLKDALGRMSGFDPTTNRRYDDINNSYGVFSIDSENPDVQAPEAVNEFDTRDPVDGLYTLTLHGTKLTLYTLSVVITRSINDSTGDVDGKEFNFKGVIDSGQVFSYVVRYASTRGAPLESYKIVQASSLRQDLACCYNLTLLGDKEIYKDLENRANKFSDYLIDKDSVKARHELEKLQEKLDQIRGDTVKKEHRKEKPPKHFMTADAYQILEEDVNALIKQMPTEKKDNKGKH
jgi:hypothetical protein